MGIWLKCDHSVSHSCSHFPQEDGESQSWRDSRPQRSKVAGSEQGVPWLLSGSPALYQPVQGPLLGSERGTSDLGLFLRDGTAMLPVVGRGTWPSGPLASTGMPVGSACLQRWVLRARESGTGGKLPGVEWALALLILSAVPPSPRPSCL